MDYNFPDSYPLVLTKEVYLQLQKSPYRDDAICLYLYYQSKSLWAKNGGPVKMNVDEVASDIDWAVARVRRAKRVLRESGIIRENTDGSWNGVELGFVLKGKPKRAKSVQITSAEFIDLFPASWKEDSEFVELWEKWEAYRREEFTRPLNFRGADIQASRLIRSGIEAAKRSIETALIRSYPDLFPKDADKKYVVTENKTYSDNQLTLIHNMEIVRGCAMIEWEKDIVSKLWDDIEITHSRFAEVAGGNEHDDHLQNVAKLFLSYYPTVQELAVSYVKFVQDMIAQGYPPSIQSLSKGSKVWMRYFATQAIDMGDVNLEHFVQ